MHHHSHGHAHGHSHAETDSTRIGWAFWLNFCFTIIEFIGGWLTNSVAIMADAVHDLGDTLSIDVYGDMTVDSALSPGDSYTANYIVDVTFQ